MSFETSSIGRIAHVKAMLKIFRNHGLGEQAIYRILETPIGMIEEKFDLTADCKTVRCIAGSAEPIPAELTNDVRKIIGLNNRFLAVQLDLDPNNRLYTYVTCPYDDFLAASLQQIELTMHFAATSAVYNAMSLALDQGDVIPDVHSDSDSGTLSN